MQTFWSRSFVALLVTCSVGCPGPGPGPKQEPPSKGNYVSSSAAVDGSTTLDSRDLNAAADAIVRGILSQPKIAGRKEAPILIIDATAWKNESTATLNMNMLADNINTAVVEKAEGRVRVIDREAAALVEKERALKRDGVVGGGTNAPTQATFGADYRLELRITDRTGVHQGTGTLDRSFQLAFKLIDMETTETPWAKSIQVRKTGTDDVIYQ